MKTDNKNEKSFNKYKIARSEAMNEVNEAKYKAYDDFYCKFDMKEGEEDIYRLARLIEKRIRDLSNIKRIEHQDNKVLVKDNVFNEICNFTNFLITTVMRIQLDKWRILGL